MTLIEPLLRRAAFLSEAVAQLGVEHVAVVRKRAEEVARTGRQFDVVTARAVAPLPKLAGWCLPLLRPRGQLAALKGESAAAELLSAEPELRRLGASDWALLVCGRDALSTPTTVVRVSVA